MIATHPVFTPEAVAQGTERRQRAAQETKRRARSAKPPPGQDTLAQRQGVRELIAVYERAAKDIRDGFALVSRAERALTDAFVMKGSGRISVENRNGRVYFDQTDDAIAGIERELWGYLVARLELNRFMSMQASRDLDQQLSKGDLPPLTVENVLAMAEGFRRQIPDMLQAAVLEVFEWLTPQNGRYKTNSKLECPRRVVLGYILERADRRWTHHWRVNHGYEQRLSALENVFSSLDGQGSVTKNYYSEISTAIKACPDGETCEGSTRYFKFRGFRNGNMHLTFLRLDLLKRFNQIAGGARLRPKAEEAAT